jgi:two-component system, OmpR family, phosphate regulon sensor histidine kinase PhoR
MASAVDPPAASGAEHGPSSSSDFNALLLAMAAHDLRQPLQVIMNSYARLARHNVDRPQRDYIAHGELAVARLTKHLDNLTTAVRIHEHAANLGPSAVQLGPLLPAVCRENSELAAEKGIDLRAVPTSAVIASEAILLDGILRNLVHNAIKYTPPGGRALIGCRRRGSQIAIEVRDTGVGIPHQRLSMIFDAFYRADATTAGLGLGLFIVRRASDILGHRIGIESTVGRGTCFVVSADLMKPSVSAGASFENAVASSRSGRPKQPSATEFKINLPVLRPASVQPVEGMPH